MSLISIVIPAYRARNFISYSLASVFQQTVKDWELIIVDDASPEPIDDLLEPFAKRATPGNVRLIKHERNLGLGGARNTGIIAAKGSVIAFLDHDDIWLPNHLECLVAELKRHEADVAFSVVEMFDSETGDRLGKWSPTDTDLAHFQVSLFHRCFITPSAVIVRKDKILTAGLFSTCRSVHYVEDLDLWLRMLALGFRFAHLPRVTCRYRKHSMSATKQLGLMELAIANVRYLHVRELQLPCLEKKRTVANGYRYAATCLWKSNQRRKALLAMANAFAIRTGLRSLI